ncbi:P-loop NTPase [Flavobacteriaceae bacterium Ap0902]|nr:P-loop NTPase [Flavobacteriaceae bacterium Ap0902]
MSFTKKDVEKILIELNSKEWVQNIQIFGNKLMIDAVSPSPALHDKKKLEDALINAFKDKLPEAEVQVKVTAKPKPSIQPIKGNPIKGIKNIVAIASGKGGVGKSTVTANMAISLHKMGFKVGILDADIYGPSMPVMFDVEDGKPRSIEKEGKSKMLPIESYGIKVLSIGFFAGLDQAVVWRGAMASKAIHQLIHDADWGDLDFLLIDLPPGTGDIHLSIVQEVPVTGAVIVSTPQTVALADARKGVSMFKMDAINVPVLGFVENMAYFTPEELPENKYYLFGQNGVKNLAEKMDIPFLGEIPIIQSIREASDVGRPAALQVNTIASAAYTEIAKNMVGSLAVRNKDLPPTEAVRITTMAGCSTK